MHDLESTPSGIDFPEGKWLLNGVNSPEVIKEKLTKITYSAFHDKFGDNLNKEADLTNARLPYVQVKSNKLILSEIKKTTNYDYLINVVSESTTSDIGSIKIGQTYSKRKNIAHTILEIYDLNTLEQIYYRKVIGQVHINEHDNEDFALVKSANGIMINCLKKIIKKIK